jgi:hypothetical protein
MPFMTTVTDTVWSLGNTLETSSLYYWKIIAISPIGKTANPGTWVFTTVVPTGSPATVTLTSPNDGATGIPVEAQLSWSASEGATGYKLYLAKTMLDLYNDYIPVSETSYTANVELAETYYWRVVAYNSSGNALSSIIRKFSTGKNKSGGGGGCMGP